MQLPGIVGVMVDGTTYYKSITSTCTLYVFYIDCTFGHGIDGKIVCERVVHTTKTSDSSRHDHEKA